VTTTRSDSQVKAPQALLLNGGSSSGKTSVARELQKVLDGVWLRLGVDTLLEAMPPSLSDDDGLEVKADGEVVVGARFAAVEDWWMAGIARMVQAGAFVVIEDNFVSGPAAQERWRAALDGVSVGWVGVRCDPVRAAERERARGDRPVGMAAKQALAVHDGIFYDLEVDAGAQGPDELARRIQRHFFA
jgi:chloramphenicol 3-O phosphotransferase